MKILLVEDAKSIRVLLALWLKKYGYTVIMAEDGQQAWNILQDQQDIFLVLSDWMMPKMDGIQLCQAIRQMTRNTYIYVILMTAKTEENAVIQGMEAGADDFLVQPVNKDELRVRLNAGQRIIKLEQMLERRNQALLNSNRKVQLAYQQIRHDLEMVATMQKSLLPKADILGNTQFNWFFYPSNFVAGDMFNYFELDDNYLAFYQLDVAGHGVSSALLSFTLHHRIANNPIQKDLLLEATEQGYRPVFPEKVVTALNQEFQSSAEQMIYFSLIYGYIHQKTGEIHITQAGHPNPIHLSKINHQAKLCGEGGFPVGMLPELQYDSFRVQLQPGDRFFIYSDGVTECLNPDKQPFSESGFLALLEKINDQPLEKVLEKVGNTLKTWRNHIAFDDDLSLLAFEWKP